MIQYLNLLKEIKEKGTWKDAARENMPRTLSLFGAQMRFNLQDGFPILTTKKVNFKAIVEELLWFMRGQTNIKPLVDKGVNIWNEDHEMFKSRNNWTEEGEMGYQYPWLWRSWGKEDRKWQPKPIFKDPMFNNELPIVKKSKSKFVGKKINTLQGYEYLIYDYNSDKNIYYIVFTHNGLLWEKKTSVGFEKVQYPYHKTCMNIACIGRVDKNYDKKLYSVWKGMLNRCYDTNNISYGLYGGKGVFVDNRWLCLEYFIEDVKSLKNWDLKQENWSKYTLEKDFGRGYIYSKNDCIWSQYNFSRLDRPVYYTFENKETKEVYQTNNLADFGRHIKKEKLVNAHSKKLIDGKIKSLGGWVLTKTADFTNKGIDQLQELIDGIKKNPMSRRHVLTAWNPATLDDMALNACHSFVQFNCRPLTFIQRANISGYSYMCQPTEEELDWDHIPKYHIDCHLYQRSADVILGVPFNITSYALLTEIVAKLTGNIVGEFIHSFGDVHIYENHMEAVEEQLKRTPDKLPTLYWNTSEAFDPLPELDDFLNGFEFEDIRLSGYNPQPAIKAKLSTGLNK